MKFFLQIFTWWNDQTMGTRFFTWRKGVKVGEDASGNRYYAERKGRRRWVIYNGLAEPSRVPPEWHGWLHHIVDETPSEDYKPREWQKPHKPNATGTARAYRPKTFVPKTRASKTATSEDYQAWRP